MSSAVLEARSFGRISNSVRFLCKAESYIDRVGNIRFIHTNQTVVEFVKFSICGVRNSGFRVPIYRLADILDITVEEIEARLSDNGSLVEFDFAPISGDFDC